MEGLTPATNAFVDLEVIFTDQSIDPNTGIASGMPFTSQGIIVTNDNASGGLDILFSFDGTNVHGRARPGEIITFDFRRETKVYLKSTGNSLYRLWVW